MAQEVERAVVGPVQVVEQQHHRLGVACGDATQGLGGGMEAATTDLSALVADVANVRAVAEVQADQLPEQMGMGPGRLGALVGEQRRHAPLDLRPGALQAVVVAEAERPGDDLAQQSVGLALGLRSRPAVQDLPADGFEVGRARHFIEQPALADARLGNDSDDGEPAFGGDLAEDREDRFELGVAADHARRHALDAARRGARAARHGALYQPAADRRVHALDGHRFLGDDLEPVAHQGMGVVADAQGPGGRGLLHPRRDVDRQATNAAFAVDAAAEQDAAGVDADTHPEAGVAMSRLHLLADGPALGQQGEAAVHRALGIVFAHFVGAEGGEQVVAGVLQHPAAVRLDDGAEARQRAVDDGMDLFRVEVLR